MGCRSFYAIAAHHRVLGPSVLLAAAAEAPTKHHVEPGPQTQTKRTLVVQLSTEADGCGEERLDLRFMSNDLFLIVEREKG